MIHQMKLNNGPFQMIRSGQKTIEMRLYDEKRRTIKCKDIIEFTNTSTQEKISCLVIGIHLYDSFKGLYNLFSKESLGYKASEEASYKDMEVYYSNSDIIKYGVIGIEIAVINSLDEKIYYKSINSENTLNDIQL